MTPLGRRLTQLASWLCCRWITRCRRQPGACITDTCAGHPSNHCARASGRWQTPAEYGLSDVPADRPRDHCSHVVPFGTEWIGRCEISKSRLPHALDEATSQEERE